MKTSDGACKKCLRVSDHEYDVGIVLGPLGRPCTPCMRGEGWRFDACPAWQDGVHAPEPRYGMDLDGNKAYVDKVCACGRRVEPAGKTPA